MELAKINSKGQVTIPMEIRRKIGVKEGDTVLFIQEGNKIVIINASINPLREVQEAFKGAAEEQGIKNEQDVVDMVKEIRAERQNNYTILPK